MTTPQRIKSILEAVNSVSEVASKLVLDNSVISAVHELYMTSLPLLGEERLSVLLSSLNSNVAGRKITNADECLAMISAIMRQIKYVNASKLVSVVHKALNDGDATEIATAGVNLKKAMDMLACGNSVKVDTFVMSKKTIKDVSTKLVYSYTHKTDTVFDTWAINGSGELGVILAPPGVGKTTALVCVGRALAKKAIGPVFHFSLEIGLTGVINKYMSGWKDYNDEHVYAYYAPASTMTVDLIRSKVESDASMCGSKPVAIVVDHLSHLAAGAGSSSQSNKFEKINDNVLALKSMAYEFGCPVWTAVQPQRSPVRDMKSVPSKGSGGYCLGMQDVAECWAIPQVADNLLSINQTDAEREDTPIRARLHNAKARNPKPDACHRNTIGIEINYSTCSFDRDDVLI